MSSHPRSKFPEQGGWFPAFPPDDNMTDCFRPKGYDFGDLAWEASGDLGLSDSEGAVSERGGSGLGELEDVSAIVFCLLSAWRLRA